MNRIIMPLQPIKAGRFIPNKIVSHLLDTHPTLDLNDLARMKFTVQERMQFAQLIGYSLNGFSELSYVDDETYGAAMTMNEGIESELTARNNILREQLDSAKAAVRDAAVSLFRIHPE